MQDAAALRQIKPRHQALAPLMDERMQRQWAATEAQSYGRGGVSAVSSATGMARNTIRKGLVELVARLGEIGEMNSHAQQDIDHHRIVATHYDALVNEPRKVLSGLGHRGKVWVNSEGRSA